MARRATPAFDTVNPHAENSHARLLECAKVIRDDVQLAAMFRVSVPTVIKWKRLPLGHIPEFLRRRETATKNKAASGATDGGKSDQANEDVAGPTVEHNQSITSPAPQTTEV